MANGLLTHLEYAPASQGARVQRLLAEVKGVHLDNAYSGRLTVGKHSAQLRLEPGDLLRVQQQVEETLPPRAALEQNLHLPGNLRFAAVGPRLALLADTRLDGEAHLRDSFGEISQGLRRVLSGSCVQRRPKGEPVAAAAVQSALDQADWDEDVVVRLDDGWELRPRIQGDATPVRLGIDRHDLRLQGVVLPRCDDDCTAAVAVQALRFNAQLRHARLAWDRQAVVAETRLHGALVNSNWLATATWAVAMASRLTRTTLEVLARHVEVARHFSEMFPIER